MGTKKNHLNELDSIKYCSYRIDLYYMKFILSIYIVNSLGNSHFSVIQFDVALYETQRLPLSTVKPV